MNVEALINLYESGELGPRQLGDAPVYLVNGKRVDKNPWEDESVPPQTISTHHILHLFTLMISLGHVSPDDTAERTSGKSHMILYDVIV